MAPGGGQGAKPPGRKLFVHFHTKWPKVEGFRDVGHGQMGHIIFRCVTWVMSHYISETVRDRGIVTMEDEYKVVCALSNGATFDDLE